jgi:lysozyme
MRIHTHLGRRWAAAAIATATVVSSFVGTASSAQGGTFGVDVSTWQRDIDFTQVRREGAAFAIVKLGGLNVAPQYVSPFYRAMVDRARGAGLRIGHYYVPGRGLSAVQQADFFVNNLHNFDRNRDVLALDDEVLDGNGVFFRDGDATAFLRRVIHRTGIPAKRVWLYIDAHNARNNAPWPGVISLGIRFWWAAWGAQPTGHTPDHEPQLRGAFPRWDIHQYTNRVRIAGKNVDGNFSRHSLTELFG